MKKCAATGKRKYPTQLACMLANCRRPIMARAYRCAVCGMWHLTRVDQDARRTA